MDVAMIGGGALMLIVGLILACSGPFDAEKVQALSLERDELHGSVSELKVRLVAKRRRLAEVRAAQAREEERIKSCKGERVELDERLAVETTELSRALERIATARSTAAQTPAPARAAATPAPPRSEVDTIRQCEKTVLVIKTDLGFGSGFIFSEDGYAATNYHVIRGSSTLAVFIQKRDSRQQIELKDARLVAADHERDLAIFKLPDVPAEVAVDGHYPAAPLRLALSARTGETVIAIGNPGAGGRILDYSVTKGIVSNPGRVADKVKLIQTSAPVNQGNSGGPLYDGQGKIVGIVTLKGVDVEAVAFAVPASALQELWKRRSEEPFVVGGTLEEWEKKHVPLAMLVRLASKLDPELSVQFEHDVAGMLLSRDGKVLYMLAPRERKLVELDVGTLKTKRTFDTDTRFNDWDIDPRRGAFILLSSSETGRVLRLRTRDLKLDGQVSLTPAPSRLACLGDVDESVVITSRVGLFGSPRLLTGRDFRSAKPCPVPLAFERSAALVACDGGRLYFLCLATKRDYTSSTGAGSLACELAVYPLTKILPNIRAIARIHRTYPASRRPAMDRKIYALYSGIRRFRLRHAMSLELFLVGLSGMSGIQPAGRSRIILARRSFKVSNGVFMEGLFESGPQVAGDEASKLLLEVMGNIRSVSIDGKWAASCTHIYDVRTRKILKRLPFTTSAQVFSRDGKSIYLFDRRRRLFYCLRDWATNAPAPATPDAKK
ncbi:MAG: S1C family serine protease [Planctomycetota bacterium]